MIELKDIHKSYKTTKVSVHALRGVSLKIDAGEFVAIMGPSGSGKSTLLQTVGLLDRPDSGTYTLSGQHIHQLKGDELSLLRNKVAGFIFQQFRLLPRISALENVRLPLVYAGSQQSEEKAKEKIDEVGLSARAHHRPNELSGGEQQRVAIARALTNEPLMILADEPTGNLDTQSAEEIVAILKKLNQKGNTIIMVTHEVDIARHANRIISMRDGQIVSDERRHGQFSKELAAMPGISVEKMLSKQHKIVSKVKFAGYFRQAMQAILAHKLRSFLSTLGILIGISAVIAMLALVEGAKEDMKQQLSSLGSNLLTVMPGGHMFKGVSYKPGSFTRLTLEDAEALAKLPYVAGVSASIEGDAQLVYGNKNWNTSVEGVSRGYETIRNETPMVGRFFTNDELQMRMPVVLLGVTVVKELFSGANPMGATVKINRRSFRVIGVLPQKGGSGWRDRDDHVIVPITTAMYRVLGRDFIDSIDVGVKDSSLLEETSRQIEEVIIKRHHLKDDDQDSFSVFNAADIQKMVQGTVNTMGVLFSSIAGISLLVGGIGIMNIMLVSVTERTGEIGLRKALGAREKEIMLQFLVESVVISVSGGVLGIIFGVGIAILLSLVADWSIQISVFSIALATLASVAAGMGFGLWPAHQAAKLDPIEALRYE